MQNKNKDLGRESRKEAFKYSLFFAITTGIWIIGQNSQSLKAVTSQELRRLNFHLDIIYTLVMVVGIYLFTYDRSEKTREINEKLIRSIREEELAKKESQVCQINLDNQIYMTESFIEDINLGVVTWDRDRKIQSVNPYFLRVTDYSEEDVIGNNFMDFLCDGQDESTIIKATESVLSGSKKIDYQIKLVGKYGNRVEFSTYNMPVLDHEGRVKSVQTFAFDLTEKNKLEQKLSRLAYYDNLTGIPNKHHLINYLKDRVDKAKEEDACFGLVYIDIYNYKLANDLDHEDEDVLMKEISYKLAGHMGQGDYLAKVGEDEFVVIFANNLEKNHIESKVSKILDSILDPIIINRNTVFVDCKIGVTVYPHMTNNPRDLIKEAHLASYYARLSGDKHYHFYDEYISRKIERKNYIIKEIDTAIKDNVFIPHFQPIVDMETGDIVALETLIRWIHPEMGFVSPGEFIPISEDTGQIHDITKLIIQKTLIEKSKWNDMGYRDLKVAINISSKTVNRANFELAILEMLRDYDIQPEELILEITETAAMDEASVNRIQNLFLRLNGIGVEVALDDFGTGNSSLARLNRLKIDYLKLDAEFTNNMEDSVNDRAIVETVIKLAKKLDVKVIAEGIEFKEQMDSLLEMNCLLGQGYYLARPDKAENINKLLKNGLQTK